MHDWTIWVLVAATALHVAEEHALGWQGWAEVTLGARLGVHPTWSDFWATNGALIVIAVAAAAVGWRAPAFALSLPALQLINASLFHVLPSALARRPNPGCLTAVALYLPISAWCYVAAGQDDRLAIGTLVLSVVLGALLMATRGRPARAQAATGLRGRAGDAAVAPRFGRLAFRRRSL